MRILLTHRYFWPDSSPYGVILRQIGEELTAAGHEVQIFTSKPSYGKDAPDAPAHQQLGEMTVRRIWVPSEARRNPLIRVLNVLIYCIALFVHVLRSRADVVTACTFPPVLAAWSASLAARLTGARFIYHMQDIHPEVSTYSGGRLGRGLPAQILRWLDNQTLRRAFAIVTLSEDMAETLRARGLGALPIHIINNPPLDADGEAVAPPADLRKHDGTVRVIFAGNLGRFQNLPLLAEGVALCFDDHPELELMFMGHGVALPELNACWGDHPQVRFAPFLPFAQARGIIADADVGLVSLSPNIYRVAYPSKIATYHKLGLRILALVEPESQLARDLERCGEGAVPAAATPPAIAVALERLIAAPMPIPNSRHDQWASASWGQIVDALRSDCR
ncbi:glycosyltransferase family 4 protein [Sinisalibacter lacisalsi]|uniref:Glycosyltransferase WbuB n=1 Tax=Sinisalibacter lacisalsi TaxID=1526570 RepID=A0ABQ1QK19_9RHOB|nr:glycosyltransferase family 4 protein [Sinisalibacter lacisalsi]GGD30097.1 glycosyltransferase WbuB [Sinisalibacter lacisalsi]